MHIYRKLIELNIDKSLIDLFDFVKRHVKDSGNFEKHLFSILSQIMKELIDQFFHEDTTAKDEMLTFLANEQKRIDGMLIK